MSVPFGFSYQRVKSNTSIQEGSWYGEYQFDFMSESEEWISMKNCYISVLMDVVQCNEGGYDTTNAYKNVLQPIVNAGGTRPTATDISIPYVNQNPLVNLFQVISCDIAGENITYQQNIAPINTLYRTLYESRQEQPTINSTNKLVPMSLLDADCQPNKPMTPLLDYWGDNPNVNTAATGILHNLANFTIAGNNMLTNRQLWALGQMVSTSGTNNKSTDRSLCLLAIVTN